MENLKDLRKLKKLTQSELAVIVGISYQQIQKYENGKDFPSLGMRLKIAKALSLSISSVLSKDEMDGIGELVEKEVERQRDDLVAQISLMIKPAIVGDFPEDINNLVGKIQTLSTESRSFFMTATNNLIDGLQK